LGIEWCYVGDGFLSRRRGAYGPRHGWFNPKFEPFKTKLTRPKNCGIKDKDSRTTTIPANSYESHELLRILRASFVGTASIYIEDLRPVRQINSVNSMLRIYYTTILSCISFNYQINIAIIIIGERDYIIELVSIMIIKSYYIKRVSSRKVAWKVLCAS
jgi:hypothetical protein